MGQNETQVERERRGDIWGEGHRCAPDQSPIESPWPMPWPSVILNGIEPTGWGALSPPAASSPVVPVRFRGVVVVLFPLFRASMLAAASTRTSSVPASLRILAASRDVSVPLRGVFTRRIELSADIRSGSTICSSPPGPEFRLRVDLLWDSSSETTENSSGTLVTLPEHQTHCVNTRAVGHATHLAGT